jgi:hypothetical protein
MAKKTKPTTENNFLLVTLGDKQWEVPRLGSIQNRIVSPLLLEIVPKIITAKKEGGSDFDQFAKYLDTATYDKLLDIAYTALTRAHPELTRDEFNDLPITVLELVVAMTTIAKQAGLFRTPFQKPGETKR